MTCGDEGASKEADKPKKKIVKTDAEWRAQLTRQQYKVARRKGTERAYSGAYWKTKDDGIYLCVCCGQPLFDSKTKYESRTGWPSFWDPIDKDAVANAVDRSESEVRIEVLCSRCDAHLGHVFPDGPRPTGQRYCMNSASLKLVDRSAVSESKSSSADQSQPDKPGAAGKND
ncbi:MAG: peptide-methionine (R)-S-oxide reductase MsrB [Planctomycetaceae bacterium]